MTAPTTEIVTLRSDRQSRLRQVGASLRGPTVRFAAGRIVPSFLAIASAPVISRVLGTEGYGTISLIVASTAIGTAAILGWAEPLAVRELAHSKPRVSRILLRSLTGAASAVLCVACVASVAAGVAFGSLVIALSGVACALVGWVGLCVGVARARGNAVAFVTTAIAGLGARSTGGAIAVLLGFGITGYLVGWLSVLICAAVVGVVLLRIPIRHLRPSLPRTAALRYAVPISGVAVSFLALQVADRMVLSPIVGLSAVGVYALGYTIVEAGLALCASVLHARRFPALIEKWTTRRSAALQDLKVNVSVAFMLPMIIAPVVTIYGPFIMTVVGGEDYAPSSGWFLGYIAAGLAFCGAAQWLSVDLQFRRETVKWFLAMAIALVVNVAIVLALAAAIGIVAGSLATLLSYGCMCALIIVWSDEGGLGRIFYKVAIEGTGSCGAAMTSIYFTAGLSNIKTLAVSAAVFCFTFYLLKRICGRLFQRPGPGPRHALPKRSGRCSV